MQARSLLSRLFSSSPRFKFAKPALITVFAIGIQSVAGADVPRVRLLDGISENLNEVASSSTRMEQDIQSSVLEMKKYQDLYASAQCSTGDPDPGCDQILKGVNESFLNVMKGMQSALPEIETALEPAYDRLSNRLRTEIGRKLTPSQVQELVTKNNNRQSVPGVQSRTGRVGKLSKRMRAWSNFLQRAAGRSDVNQATIAADLYYDLDGALGEISYMRDLIDSLVPVLELPGGMGMEPTEEMQQLMANAGSLLFGEEGDQPLPDMLPEEVAKDPYDFSKL